MDTAVRHRMHYWRGAAAMFVLGGILGTALIFLDEGLSISLLGLAFGLGCGALWALGFQFLLSRLSYVEVQPDGVGGSTFWGRRGFMKWDQIRSARRYDFLAMGLVHVRASGGSPSLWLPTYVARQQALVQDLRKLAPTGSPLPGCFAAP